MNKYLGILLIILFIASSSFAFPSAPSGADTETITLAKGTNYIRYPVFVSDSGFCSENSLSYYYYYNNDSYFTNSDVYSVLSQLSNTQKQSIVLQVYSPSSCKLKVLKEPTTMSFSAGKSFGIIPSYFENLKISDISGLTKIVALSPNNFTLSSTDKILATHINKPVFFYFGSASVIDKENLEEIETITYSCTDSDGGNSTVQKYTKGNVSITDSTDKLINSSSDYCTSDNKLVEYSCYSSTSNYITEAYPISCPTNYTCSDGACIVETFTNSCSDTDSGNKPFDSGIVTYNNTTYKDTLFISNSNYYLTEYYCENNELRHENHLCVYGGSTDYSLGTSYCRETSPIISTCTDTDEMNKYTRGDTIVNNIHNIDYCTISNNSNAVVEFYCDSIGYLNSQTFVCENGCSFGACIPKAQIYGTQCSETDNGKDTTQKGQTTYGALSPTAKQTTVADICYSDTQVKEYYCSDNSLANEIIQCELNEICQDGACIPKAQIYGTENWEEVTLSLDTRYKKYLTIPTNYEFKVIVDPEVQYSSRYNHSGTFHTVLGELNTTNPKAYCQNATPFALLAEINGNCEDAYQYSGTNVSDSEIKIYFYVNDSKTSLGDNRGKIDITLKYKSLEEITCIDSDNGKDYEVSGYTKMSNSSTRTLDSCSLENGKSYLTEQYCEENEQKYETIECTSCTYRVCTNPITENQCIDTDNGKTYNIKGETYIEGSDIKSTDSCNYYDLPNGKKYSLNEYFCEDNQVKSENVDCDSCTAGVCTQTTETSDICIYLQQNNPFAYAFAQMFGIC